MLVVTILAKPLIVSTSYGTLFQTKLTFINICCVVENAKNFKEELLKRNVKNSNALNLNSLRLGINSVLALSNNIHYRKFEKLNIADNAITDYGMHAVKSIIASTKLASINLASNMISGEGLELFLDDLI